MWRNWNFISLKRLISHPRWGRGLGKHFINLLEEIANRIFFHFLLWNYISWATQRPNKVISCHFQLSWLSLLNCRDWRQEKKAHFQHFINLIILWSQKVTFRFLSSLSFVALYMLMKRTEWALNSFENGNKYFICFIIYFYLIAPLSSQEKLLGIAIVL